MVIVFWVKGPDSVYDPYNQTENVMAEVSPKKIKKAKDIKKMRFIPLT